MGQEYVSLGAERQKNYSQWLLQDRAQIQRRRQPDNELFGGQTIHYKHRYKCQSDGTKAPTYPLGGKNGKRKNINTHLSEK